MRWKTKHVVVRALVDDVIWPRPEPNKPEPTCRADQQGERHELAKVRRHRAARHATAVNLLDVGRGTGGWRVGRQFADGGWGGGARAKLTSGGGGGQGRLRLRWGSRLLAAAARFGSECVCVWVGSWVKPRSDRRYSDKCDGGWFKSPPGEVSVLAGGLSWPPA
jgi:hypothetical protein